MMKHRLVCHLVLGVLLIGLVSVGAAAATPGQESQLFPEDVHLAQTVTVRAGHVYLGELLEQLSREAGLRLTVEDTRGPVSGIRLSVFVRGLSIRQTMLGLADLLSHRHDRWEWQAAPKGGAGYILRHQLSPEEAAAAARREILAKWTADVRAFHEIARLPERERTARAAARSDLYPPSYVDWDRSNLFGELSPSDLETLLRGTQVPVHRSGLTARGKKAYDRIVGSALGSRVANEDAARAEVSFYVKWDRNYTGPVLANRVSDSSGGSTETNLLGGLAWDFNWKKSADDTWLHSWDADVQEYLKKRASGDISVGRTYPRPLTMPEWLERATAKQPFNILLDPVFPRRGTYGAWTGSRPEHTVWAVVIYRYLAKRSGDLHLLRQVTATANPRVHLLPWGQVKALRQAAVRNGGYLDLAPLATLGQMNPDQLVGLSQEFPDAELSHVERWLPILRFYLSLDPAAQARLLTPAGLPYRDAGLQARRTVEATPDPRNDRGLAFLSQHFSHATVSLHVERLEDEEREGRQLVWQIRAPGTDGHKSLFVQRPRRPLSIQEQQEREAQGLLQEDTTAADAAGSRRSSERRSR